MAMPNRTDVEGLLVFHKATHGESWPERLRWDLEKDPLRWHGVRFDSNGRVVAIELDITEDEDRERRRLQHLGSSEALGSIPPELCNLDKLQVLRLVRMGIGGIIPREIGQLESLEYLNLSNNEIKGIIPIEIGQLGSLQTLILSKNRITGAIPIEIGQLGSLEKLVLRVNRIEGTIPSEIGRLGNLTYLNLSFNKIGGTIPIEVGQLGSLRRLIMRKNRIKGTIPSEVRSLGSLEYLDLNNNGIQGTIPREVGRLGSLEYLDLSNNEIEGTIPGEIGQLRSLQKLILNNNKIQGIIPREIGQLRGLQEVILNNNKIQGTIPSEVGELGVLHMLILSNNEIEGAIPGEIGQLRSLQKLILNNNKLQGTIPSEIGQLRSLQEVILNNNKLQGTIPSKIGEVESLEYLDMSNNVVHGTVPDEVGGLRRLKHLNLSNNKIEGTIPSKIGEVKSLEYLDMSNNVVHGTVPDEVGGLWRLKHLNLSNNKIEGTIPRAIGHFLELRYLNLSYNRFQGLWRYGRTDADGKWIRDSGPWSPRELLGNLENINSEGYLSLTPNPSLRHPPEAVVKLGMETVSNYYAEKTLEVDRTVRVMIVGQSGAGKTRLYEGMGGRRQSSTHASDEQSIHVNIDHLALGEVAVSLYDFSGKVEDIGLLKIFVRGRASCFLAFDASSFGPRSKYLNEGEQLEADIRQLETGGVLEWYQGLLRNLPQCYVTLVGTKCDLLSPGDVNDIGDRIYRACRRSLHDEYRISTRMLDRGVALTSCDFPTSEGTEPETPGINETSGDRLSKGAYGTTATNLLRRVVKEDRDADEEIRIQVPRHLHAALTMLDHLRMGRDPIQWMSPRRLTWDQEETKVMQGSDTWRSITRETLDQFWNQLKDTLQEHDLRTPDPISSEDKNILIENAYEEALLMSEQEGFIFRCGSSVFPDVMWEEVALRPIVRQIEEEESHGKISLGKIANASIELSSPEDQISWQRFKRDGTLEPALARVLWPGNLWDDILPALASDGLALPVSVDEEDIILVLPRLRLTRPPSVSQDLSFFRNKQHRVLRAECAMPRGISSEGLKTIISRVTSIARECTFWRSGVLAKGYWGGENEWGGIYALLLDYSYETSALTMEVYGNVRSEIPWLVQSFTMSIALKAARYDINRRMDAFVRCPDHDDSRLPVSRRAQLPGASLLDRQTRCSKCNPETRGLGDFAIAMLTVVDSTTSPDDIFQELSERFVYLTNQDTWLDPQGIDDTFYEDDPFNEDHRIRRTLLPTGGPPSLEEPRIRTTLLPRGGPLSPEEPLTLVSPSQWSVGQFRLQDDQVRLYVGDGSCQRGQVAGPINVSAGYRLVSCGDQFLTSKAVDCKPSGMKFDEPLYLDFLVGHYWDRSEEEASMDLEAYKQHLWGMYKVLWREDSASRWHLLDEAQTEMLEEDGKFFFRSSIDHFSEIVNGRQYGGTTFVVERFSWFSWKRPGSDQIWFTNATEKELIIIISPSSMPLSRVKKFALGIKVGIEGVDIQRSRENENVTQAEDPQEFILNPMEARGMESWDLPSIPCTTMDRNAGKAIVTIATRDETTCSFWIRKGVFKTRSRVTITSKLFTKSPLVSGRLVNAS